MSSIDSPRLSQSISLAKFPPKLLHKVTDEPRNLKMYQYLAHCGNYLNGHLNVDSSRFKPITEECTDFCNMPLASCGGNPRYVVLFDPKNSPEIHHHFEALKKQLTKNIYSTFEKLMIVREYVNDTLFPYFDTLGKVHDKFTSPDPGKTISFDGKDYSLIYLDCFAQVKLAVCVERALTCAYFLDRLVKDPPHLLNGFVQIMRDDLDDGEAHHWVTLTQNDSERWHIDSAIPLHPTNFMSRSGKQEIIRFYGDRVYQNMVRKTALDTIFI